jgi:hypothetical protein
VPPIQAFRRSVPGSLAAALVLVAGLIQPRTASADWHIAPFIGLVFGGDTNLIDLEGAAGEKRVMYGAQGTWLGDGWLGAEVDFGYLPGSFESDNTPRLVNRSRVLTLMGNVVLAAPRGLTRESLRPYVSGGLGLIRPSADDFLQQFPIDSNLLGMNIGGGATGFLTARTGLRWDLRRFRTVKGTDEEGMFTPGSTRLSFWRATMGVVIRY